MLPEQLGPYRLIRPIAQGGMAEVFEVENPVSGEHLALKLLVQQDSAQLRFDREYEAMIRLNHPNIVRVFDYGFHGRFPWFTMELIDGTPCQAYAKRLGKAGSEHRTREVLRVAHDLALALDHIHVRGLIHRDLKSANVLVLPDGRVKLIDFGTARVQDPVRQITREGEFIGTFAYAAPEQIKAKEVDWKADLYAFGVLLFRLVTGKLPFRSKDLQALARMQLKQPPPRPSDLVPGLPPGLDELILALLEKKAPNRPERGALVAHRLEEIVGEPLMLPGTLQLDLGDGRPVGRDREVKELWRFLDGGGRGGSGPGRRSGDVALVVGLDGSGRMRLLQAADAEVNRRGWRSAAAYFVEGRGELGRWADTLSKLSRHFGARKPQRVVDAIALLDEVRTSQRITEIERIAGLRQVAFDLLDVLTRSSKNPVVLFLQNMEHMGPTGFELLVTLRTMVRDVGLPVLFVGGIHERADDSGSLARLRLDDALRIPLQPMSVRDVSMMVGSLLNRRPPPIQVAKWIWKASGGLPTYVEEVTKQLVDGGRLRAKSQDQNRIEWVQDDLLDIEVPEAARIRMVESLAKLAVDRRRFLEGLALLGGEGSVSAVAVAMERTPTDLREATADLVRAGWITVERRKEGPYARLRQILAEHVLLEHLHPCRRRVMERHLITEVADDPAFAEQIDLLKSVGRYDEALHRALDWAIHHLSRNQPVTALKVLDHMVDVVEKSNLEREEKAQLYLLHVTALLMVRPLDSHTSKSLASATRLFQGAGPLFESETHLVRARLQRVIGHFPNYRRELLKAWELVESEPPHPLAATIAERVGWAHQMSGKVEDAAGWQGRARRIAVQVQNPVVLAHADTGVAGWQYARGLINEAERTLLSAIRTFDQFDDRRGLATSLSVWASCLTHQARFSEALGVLRRQLPSMRESEAPSFYVQMLLATAEVESALGRLGKAQELVDELLASLRKGELLDLRLEAYLLYGRILVESDLYDDAYGVLRQVITKSETAGLVVLAGRALALEGRVLAARQDERAAHASFQKANQLLLPTGHMPALADACTQQARSWAHRRDPDQIFKPVMEFLENQPTPALQVEYLLAKGWYMAARRQDPNPTWHHAVNLLHRMATILEETDQAALRLHPWVRVLRRTGIEVFE